MVDCGSLEDPDNGQVEFSNTTFESTVNYTCDLGYNLNGNSTHTCEANGEWSENPPSCERKWLKYLPSTSTFRSPFETSCPPPHHLKFCHHYKPTCTSHLSSNVYNLGSKCIVISPVHVNLKQQLFYVLGFIHIYHLKIIVRQFVRQFYCVIFIMLSSPI